MNRLEWKKKQKLKGKIKFSKEYYEQNKHEKLCQ